MSSSSLEVHRRQQPAKRAKLWRIVIILWAVALAIAWLVWFLRTPADLPTERGRVNESGVVDQAIYVGMFAVGDDFDRTISISEVKVDVDAEGEVSVEPKICRGGTVSVTTDATPFCEELEDPDGADFSSGDSIVLVVSASEPTEVEIGRIEVSFRDGLRWGTKEAGLEGATLVFADHTPGTVEEDTEPDAPTERPEQDDRSDDKKDKKKDKRDRQDDPTETPSATATA